MSLTVLFGLDDTDTLDHPGTNHLARHLVHRFGHPTLPSLITRHQLLKDPRVPCTKMNGCVAVRLTTEYESADPLRNELREAIIAWCPLGSDPGFCFVADPSQVPSAISAYGRRCQRELVTQTEARQLAAEARLPLEGLGGTEDGVIGALAAVGLHITGNDGRVIHYGSSQEEPFELLGPQPIETVVSRGVVEIRRNDVAGATVTSGVIDLGKRLRPNLRDGRIVLFVEPGDASTVAEWRAVKVL